MTQRFSLVRAGATALLIGAGTAALLSASSRVQAADLTVDVKNVHSAAGKVMVALHANVDGVKFPGDAGTVAAQWRKAEAGTMRFVFAGLQPGSYAVAVFHDENDNAVLDSNLLGIPSEGYGFSQDAKGFAGPPAFDAAAVELSATAEAVTTSAALGY